jgi:signal transduction histidine kinase
MDRLEEECSSDTHAFVVRMRSLVKAVLLDIGLTLDAYFSRLTDDLRQALDMYWRANAELRHFAQLASHDLKTPLATVANLCDEALDEFHDQMPSEACQLIEKAKQRSFRMSRMIDELLDATTKPPGENQLAPVALSDVMEEVLDRLQGASKDKQLELVQPSQWPLVLGNRPRLCEAFFNLVANAIKFIDKRPARIELAFEHMGEDTIVTVTDNGPGIPSEELERIFNPFRRLARDRNLPGSGLGLYFTKNLIEQQGGTVWAESTPGVGAKFFVRLRRP